MNYKTLFVDICRPNDQFNKNVETILSQDPQGPEERYIYCHDCERNPCRCKEACEYED